MKIDKSHWESTPLNCIELDTKKIQLGNKKENTAIDFILVVYHGLKLSFDRISSVNKVKDNIELTRMGIIQFIFFKPLIY